TSHGNGECLRTKGWLRMECEIGVFMCKWGNLAQFVWRRPWTRAVMVAQASRGNIAEERPLTSDRRRATSVPEKDKQVAETHSPTWWWKEPLAWSKRMLAAPKLGV